VRTAKFTDPLKDPNWASDSTYVSWALDTNGDSKPDYTVEYGVQDGQLYSSVFRAAAADDAPELCDTEQTLVSPAGVYGVRIDPACIGRPSAVAWSVEVSYDTNPTDDAAPATDDVAPDHGSAAPIEAPATVPSAAAPAGEAPPVSPTGGAAPPTQPAATAAAPGAAGGAAVTTPPSTSRLAPADAKASTGRKTGAAAPATAGASRGTAAAVGAPARTVPGAVDSVAAPAAPRTSAGDNRLWAVGAAALIALIGPGAAGAWFVLRRRTR